MIAAAAALCLALALPVAEPAAQSLSDCARLWAAVESLTEVVRADPRDQVASWLLSLLVRQYFAECVASPRVSPASEG